MNLPPTAVGRIGVVYDPKRNLMISLLILEVQACSATKLALSNL
jgi:hypothetical protein